MRSPVAGEYDGDDGRYPTLLAVDVERLAASAPGCRDAQQPALRELQRLNGR